MTGKRFTVIDHNEWSEGDIIYYDDGEEMGWMDVCDKLNALNNENELLKEIIDQLFNTITELDWAKEEYCNALIRLLGEENDVDKAKQRIREFLE